MKKRILSLLLAAVMLMAAIPAVSAADTPSFADSGIRSMDKLSKREIIALLAANPTDGAVTFDVQPSFTPPYAAGRLSQATLNAALDRLNALRRIAGLPAVSLDAQWCDMAQHGALVEAIDYQAHNITQRPAGMDDSFFQTAAEAARTSNLYSGRSPVRAVDGFMEDPGTGNLASQGHRRWQLNPGMTQVGFGYAKCPEGGSCTVEKVFGNGANYAPADYDFIAWPASGNFPGMLMNPDFGFNSTAWTVTLDPQQYANPSLSALKVKVTRQSDGKTWNLQGNYTESASDDYLNVNTGGYGVSNCIIFRPGNVDVYHGVYTVEISGLRTSGGASATLAYQVDFFDQADLSFSDVPAGAWYAEEVDYAVDNGLMKGVGNGKFNPDATISRAEVLTILARMEGANVEGGNPWYAKAMDWAHTNGVSDSDQPLEPITRAELATLLYRCAHSPGTTAGYLDRWPDASDIPSGTASGLSWCVENGIIQGSDKGLLLPLGTVTRAQVATMLMRYCTVLHI